MSDVAERAHLRARAPLDRLAQVLEDGIRAFERNISESRFVIQKLASELVEAQVEVLKAAEAQGAAAAARAPKSSQVRREDRKPEIQWCQCGLYQGTPHPMHRKRREEPDEAAPT
jgi:hypothetical protein